MNQKFKRPVFYVPANGIRVPLVIDEAREDSSGQYIGTYSREPLPKIAVRYPGATVGELDDVIASKEAMLCSDPVEIDSSEFHEALGVLPPLDFVRTEQGTTFKSEERLSGRITAVYAAIKGRYFTFNAVDTIVHGGILGKVLNTTLLELA